MSIRAIVRISPIPTSPQAAIVRSSTSPAMLSMTSPAPPNVRTASESPAATPSPGSIW